MDLVLDLQLNNLARKHSTVIIKLSQYYQSTLLLSDLHTYVYDNTTVTGGGLTIQCNFNREVLLGYDTDCNYVSKKNSLLKVH